MKIMDTNMMCILTSSRLFFGEKRVEMGKKGRKSNVREQL